MSRRAWQQSTPHAQIHRYWENPRSHDLRTMPPKVDNHEKTGRGNLVIVPHVANCPQHRFATSSAGCSNLPICFLRCRMWQTSYSQPRFATSSAGCHKLPTVQPRFAISNTGRRKLSGATCSKLHAAPICYLQHRMSQIAYNACLLPALDVTNCLPPPAPEVLQPQFITSSTGCSKLLASPICYLRRWM